MGRSHLGTRVQLLVLVFRTRNVTAEYDKIIHIYGSGTSTHREKTVCVINIKVWLLDTLMTPKTQVMQVAEWATGMRRTVDASTAA